MNSNASQTNETGSQGKKPSVLDNIVAMPRPLRPVAPTDPLPFAAPLQAGETVEPRLHVPASPFSMVDAPATMGAVDKALEDLQRGRLEHPSIVQEKGFSLSFGLDSGADLKGFGLAGGDLDIKRVLGAVTIKGTFRF